LIFKIDILACFYINNFVLNIT